MMTKVISMDISSEDLSERERCRCHIHAQRILIKDEKSSPSVGIKFPSEAHNIALTSNVPTTVEPCYKEVGYNKTLL